MKEIHGEVEEEHIIVTFYARAYLCKTQRNICFVFCISLEKCCFFIFFIQINSDFSKIEETIIKKTLAIQK